MGSELICLCAFSLDGLGTGSGEEATTGYHGGVGETAGSTVGGGAEEEGDAG